MDKEEEIFKLSQMKEKSKTYTTKLLKREDFVPE